MRCTEIHVMFMYLTNSYFMCRPGCGGSAYGPRRQQMRSPRLGSGHEPGPRDGAPIRNSVCRNFGQNPNGSRRRLLHSRTRNPEGQRTTEQRQEEEHRQKNTALLDTLGYYSQPILHFKKNLIFQKKMKFSLYLFIKQILLCNLLTVKRISV